MSWSRVRLGTPTVMVADLVVLDLHTVSAESDTTRFAGAGPAAALGRGCAGATAAAVRGPKHVLAKGAMPVLSLAEG